MKAIIAILSFALFAALAGCSTGSQTVSTGMLSGGNSSCCCPEMCKDCTCDKCGELCKDNCSCVCVGNTCEITCNNCGNKCTVTCGDECCGKAVKTS